MRHVESLSVERIPIDHVNCHPANPRRGDAALIAESLAAHGQYAPIVVQRSTRFILKGNHTWQAAVSLGWKDIDAVFVDVDDDQATRILVVDNRASDTSTYDDEALSRLLADLAGTADNFAGTGFDTDVVDRLLASLDPPPLPDTDAPDLSRFAERSCPVCHATWHEEGGQVVIHD